MKDRRLKEKVGETLTFLAQTSKKGESMKPNPLNKMNQAAIKDVREPYPKRAQSERRYIKRKYDQTKLLSGTGNTTAAVTPDGVSIVFQSVNHGHTIYWPASNWDDLRKWLDSRIEKQT